MVTVNQKSSDYLAMVDYWNQIAAIMGGVKTMRAGGQDYLPKFESESDESYKQRLKVARFTNIFRTIVEDLAARPFSKEVTFKASPAMEKMIENIDGQYTHGSKFLHKWFQDAIANGMSCVFVDYTRTDPNTIDASGIPRRKTLHEERASGARPYAILVPAIDAIAIYSAMVNGVEEFVHVRFREFSKRVDGFNEVMVEQIRVLTRDPIMSDEGLLLGFDHPRFELWEAVAPSTVTSRAKAQEFKKIDEGPISIERIPFEVLIIGDRQTGWVVNPAMNDAANLQIELYEAENGVKNLKTLTAFPMLTANGVDPIIDPKTGKPVPIPVGPRAILYTGRPEQGTPSGSWQIIEPAGTSLSFLREDVKDTAQELRELGRQPLSASSSNLTVVTTVFAARKGNAAIQNWALDLKDSAENVLMYMQKWSKDSTEPEVIIDLDFSLDSAENDGFADVLAMRSNGDLSRKTTWEEAKRRGRLSDSFDDEEEEKRLEDEIDDPGDGEDERDALLTPPNPGQPPNPENVPQAPLPGQVPIREEDDVQ